MHLTTLNYILKRYQLTLTDLSPIKIYISRDVSFPKLINELHFVKGAEIGVAHGYFSSLLCTKCPQVKLSSIDAWQVWDGCTHGETQDSMEKLFQSAKTRLTLLNNCQIIRGWSTEVAPQFADKSLDFIYIDAAHDYQRVMDDLRSWTPKVKPGGLVMGHDYINYWEMTGGDFNPQNYMVKQAVDDWLQIKKIKPLFITAKDSVPSWFYVK